jgi:hypothetical protein
MARLTSWFVEVTQVRQVIRRFQHGRIPQRRELTIWQPRGASCDLSQVRTCACTPSKRVYFRDSSLDDFASASVIEYEFEDNVPA